MTSGTLALIIGTMILGQFLLALWITVRRRRREPDTGYAFEMKLQGPPLEPHPASENDAPTTWTGFQPFRIVRREVENAAGDIASFYLEPEPPMALPMFKPGQYLTFRFDLPNEPGQADQTVIRCYSLSDRPRDDHYRITVKRTPEGRVSNYLHDQVETGTRVMVKAPSGRFHLIDQPPRPQVLIAGGIGITPMLSMLYSLLELGYEQDIWLFYGIRNGREAVMLPRLRELAEYHSQFHLRLCFSRPEATDRPGADYHHSGHIDTRLLQRELPLNRYRFYLCGPAALMEDLVPGLETIGVPAADIHYEAFGPSSLKRPAKPPVQNQDPVNESWKVNFYKSGKSAIWDGSHDSLLSFAEAEGIVVDSVCRSGSCGSCQTYIESGEVIYRERPESEIEDGHCLLCVGRPKSDLRLAI
jgi:uncharacterized protein